MGGWGTATAIDDLIREKATNWRLERMPVVDRTVLRIALYELLHQVDVPQVVIVGRGDRAGQALHFSEQSGAFVNGVLDGLLPHPPVPRGGSTDGRGLERCARRGKGLDG